MRKLSAFAVRIKCRYFSKKRIRSIDNVLNTRYNGNRKERVIMAQTTVSIRMDDSLKRDFDTICNELGMTMTTAVIMLAKKMSREKRLPFEVSIDPFYSASNIKALNESIEQMKDGKTVTKTLEELEVLADE